MVFFMIRLFLRDYVWSNRPLEGGACMVKACIVERWKIDLIEFKSRVS